jgi:hypothetical protein
VIFQVRATNHLFQALGLRLGFRSFICSTASRVTYAKTQSPEIATCCLSGRLMSLSTDFPADLT